MYMHVLAIAKDNFATQELTRVTSITVSSGNYVVVHMGTTYTYPMETHYLQIIW